MRRYRVKVESYVVVEARNSKEALSRGELALRRSVEHWYRHDESGKNFGDGWHLFGFNARKAVRVEDDDD